MVRPIEVRVLSVRIPEIPRAPGVLRSPAMQPVEAGAFGAAVQALSDHLAGQSPQSFGMTATLREIIRRNTCQDWALAASVDMNTVRPEAMTRRFLGFYSAPRILGAETYLSDFLYSGFPEGVH